MFGMCLLCLGGLRLTGLEMNHRPCGHKDTEMNINNGLVWFKRRHFVTSINRNKELLKTRSNE